MAMRKTTALALVLLLSIHPGHAQAMQCPQSECLAHGCANSLPVESSYLHTRSCVIPEARDISSEEIVRNDDEQITIGGKGVRHDAEFLLQTGVVRTGKDGNLDEAAAADLGHVDFNFLQTLTQGKKHGAGNCNAGWQFGPIIIGGLSDSGTRGARAVVQEVANVTMQSSKINEAGDDLIITEPVSKWWEAFLPLVNGTISAETFRDASQFEKMALDLCSAATESWEAAGKPQGLWGWKLPRSIVMAPVWDYLFQDYQLVHVVRDPRFNCAKGSNKVFYETICDELLGKQVCMSKASCFKFWARLNGDIFDMYHKGTTQRRQYVLMSMDRLTTPSPEKASMSYVHLERILSQIGFASMRPAVNEQFILKMLAKEHGYAATYSPAQMSPAERHELTVSFAEQCSRDHEIRRVAAKMGYECEDFGLDQI